MPPSLFNQARSCSEATIKHGVDPQRFVPILGEAQNEISLLLFASFQGDSELQITKNDLARMWSLEMQWFTPDSASSLVERLHESGWLVGSEYSLSPCNGSLIRPPELGWQPFLGRVREIPLPPDKEIDREETNSTNDLMFSQTSEGGKKSDTEDSFGRLVYMVSSLSGLDRREVLRRAKRKRLALGPVSLWMAVLLLAREQNLEMDFLIEKLGN